MQSSSTRSGYVWLVSASALGLYATLGLLGIAIPGVADLLGWLSQAEGWEFQVAGFLAILLEGLYIVGNFFPGTTMVLLLAVLSGVGGFIQFALTIVSIFVGWSIAGIINVCVAYRSLHKSGQAVATNCVVKDNLILTWYPAFRANYEVSQIAAGGSLYQVLISALRVRFFASLGAAALAVGVMQLIDINQIDNEEGFISVLVVVVIMIIVGVRQIRSKV